MAARQSKRVREAKGGPRRQAKKVESKAKAFVHPPKSPFKGGLVKGGLGSAKKGLGSASGTRAERAALARAARFAVYANIPIGDWVEMSGRAHKIVYEQAARYGIPFGSKRIDLRKVSRALHDFLAAHGKRLMAPEADPMLVDASGGAGDSAGLERYRLAKAELAEHELAQRKRDLIPIDEVHGIWEIVGSMMRVAGKQITDQYGLKAGAVINAALDGAGKAVERAFGRPKDETVNESEQTHE